MFVILNTYFGCNNKRVTHKWYIAIEDICNGFMGKCFSCSLKLSATQSPISISAFK